VKNKRQWKVDWRGPKRKEYDRKTGKGKFVDGTYDSNYVLADNIDRAIAVAKAKLVPKGGEVLHIEQFGHIWVG
jgi:hypothetical protein